MKPLNSSFGETRAPLHERKDDLYETPPEAVRALLAVEKLVDIVWEPACGPGAIVRELRSHGHKVYATDLLDYGSPDQDFARRDFLMERCPDFHIGTVLTNPPFKLAGEFVIHALTLCPRVIILARLGFYESVRRATIFDSGLLRRIHVFSQRLPRMHRAGHQGALATSRLCFAWFVFDRDDRGPTTIDRIRWC